MNSSFYQEGNKEVLQADQEEIEDASDLEDVSGDASDLLKEYKTN